MYRLSTLLLLCSIGLVAIVHCTAADPPRDSSSGSEQNDELLQAILKLKQELRELRSEARRRGKSIPSSKAKTAGSQPATRRTSPTPVTTQPSKPSPPLAPSTVRIAPASSDHWAFQPIRSPQLPAVEDSNWKRADLDRFILARLEQTGLRPNPDADRHTLIRRIAFDLTGLPPTPDEIRSFVGDSASLDVALPRVVDAYLASPRFGERWGRHWLDVARYADSVGRNWNAPFTYAWRYRNYVIDSFNKDKPYDRFITEQLAGDLMPANDQSLRREQLVATGFLALGPTDIIVPEGEQLAMDRIDEQIDVTTRTILGLTVSCARCHDHKYEPITMRDYYAMAGIFYSTETLSGQRRGNYVADDDLRILPSSQGSTKPVPGVHSMSDITREFSSGGWREVLYTTDPNLAMGLLEGRTRDCPIRIDGDFYKQGPVPARGDFNIAGLGGLRGISPTASGRLQLAEWMVSPDNPLTARVMANRIWLHLFGRGLVPSVDNFGVSGEAPTHPELLDHLAASLQQTWSIKSLIRQIVLSRTYRQDSTSQLAAQRLDPGNALYWRMNVKRLEMEAVRDAMLQAAGRLSFQRPVGIQVAGTGGKGRWGATRSLLTIDAPYRTVYLPVLRALMPEMYQTFDFPNPTQIKGQREVTTVAPQALFLMNSDFAARSSQDMAIRLLENPALSDTEGVRSIYLQLLGRPAVDEEVQESMRFLQQLTPASTSRNSDVYRWSALIQALMISGEFRSLL